jgi:pSer/pThr/pTyr-binding forkhead associated (FHA) protein
MAELIVQSGKHQGKRLRLPADAEILIGRDESCQIRLASSDVSRHHCALKQTSAGLLARDLGSRNGTYLNEVLMEDETLLQPGDLLRIGPIVFQVPGAKTEIPSSNERGMSEGGAPLSDDDIAAWLSQEALATAEGRVAGPGDTTIIPKSQVPVPDSDEIESPVAESQEAKATPTREAEAKEKEAAARQFRSTAEEAADIIRRHWELVKTQEKED